MPINDTYLVPEHVIHFLCDGERSFLALRLIYGLLYAFDQALKGKMSLVPAHFSQEHSVRTRTLAAAVGPEKAKDNRWIHEACAELADQRILRSVKIHGRLLRFRLDRNFSAAFSQPTEAFAIMSTAQVRRCRTMYDLMFLSLACLNRNKNRPLFYLPRIPVHLEVRDAAFSFMPQEPPKQAPWRASWSQSNRAWSNAAIRVSNMLGDGYLIAPRQDMIDDFVSQVAVKIQHSNTLWERQKLYKFPAGTRSVIEIPAGGKKTVLNAEALRNKCHQTVIG